MVTDLPSSFGQSFLNLCGYSMSKKAAEKCLQDAGIVINDIDIIELHDCFAPNEVNILSPTTQSHTHTVHKCRYYQVLYIY